MLAATDVWTPAEVTALVAIAGLVLAVLAAGWANGSALRAWTALGEKQAELAKQQAELAPPPTEEAAARALGRVLGRHWVSPEVTAEVMASFWAAEAPTKRTLAHVVADILDGGGYAGSAKVLAVVRGLRVTPAARPEPPSS